MENVTKRFGKVVANNAINLELREGEILSLLGENGSGKSSIVDLVIRMINNLSAALLGEKFNFSAAEHLHFIDHVYAEMAFRIDNAIYILEERGTKGRSKKIHA